MMGVMEHRIMCGGCFDFQRAFREVWNMPYVALRTPLLPDVKYMPDPPTGLAIVYGDNILTLPEEQGLQR